MTQTYVGQIMMTGFGFAQRGFSLCNGQLLSIQQNAALFALLGTSYGGNGVQTFALPNMQGRVPVGAGSSVDPAWQPAPFVIGEQAGTENVTLLYNEMPQHTHMVQATTNTADARTAGNGMFGASNKTTSPVYAPVGGGATTLYPNTIAMQGGNLPHANMQPFRVINFNISMTGVFPSRN